MPAPRRRRRRQRRGPSKQAAPQRFHVVVTVVDGDTGRRVRGALVRNGRRRRLRQPPGDAGFRSSTAAPLPVAAAAPRL